MSHNLSVAKRHLSEARLCLKKGLACMAKAHCDLAEQYAAKPGVPFGEGMNVVEQAGLLWREAEDYRLKKYLTAKKTA